VVGAIRGSNTIEGYTVSLGAASAIVDGAPVPADVPEDSREAVRGYRDALSWVMHTSEMDFFRHSETVLSLLHFTMMRHWPERSPGRYRRSGIIVTGDDPVQPAYVGPAAEEVPRLMAELAEWLVDDSSKIHVLVRGAMAHLNLVAIHPWRDGNGRMARCLQTLLIARDGRLAPEFCSIEEWLGQPTNTLAYYAALSEVQHGSYQPARNAHSWVRFCLRAHHRQAQLVDRRLAFGREVWVAIESLVERSGLGERVMSALYAAATDQLRREVYQQTEQLSRDQAIRDIRQLERAGLVEAVGYGPTLHYIAAGGAKQIADDVTTAVRRPAVEPYGG
jgi:Fic family protein